MAIPTGPGTTGSGGTDDDGGAGDDEQTQETDPTGTYQDPGATSGGTTTGPTSPTDVETGDTQEETEPTGGSVGRQPVNTGPTEAQEPVDPTGTYQDPDARPTAGQQTSPSQQTIQESQQVPEDQRGAFTELETQTRTDIQPDDIVPTRRGVQLSEEARQRELRARAARMAEADFEDIRVQGGRAPGPEATRETRVGAPTFALTSEAFIERAEQRAAEQVEERAGRQRLAQTPAGTRQAIGFDAGEVSAEQARQFSDLERGRDFTIDVQGQRGVDVAFTPEYFERELTDQLDIAAEAGEDFTIRETEEGQEVELTTEGRQQAITSELLSRGEVEVDRPEAQLPFFGTIGGGTRTIQIERASQLEFDEEGNLMNVVAPEQTEEAEQAGRERLASAVPVVGGFVSDFAFGSRDLLGAIGGASEDVGEAFGEQVSDPVSAFYEDVGDVVYTSGRAAGATVAGRESAGEAQERATEQALDVARGESGQVLAAESPGLGTFAQPEVEDVAEATAVGEQTGDFAGGAASVGRFAIELPSLVETAADVGGQAAAFTVEQPGQAPGAAADTVVNVGETIAVQAVENPAMVAGQLVGSGGVFGAARAVGPRASLATRAAIQPGEEILGYGGYGLTRRVAGRGAAQRLFPQREPLIFSEEAAIRAARRTGGAVRRGGGALRRAARGDIELTPSPRQTRLIERGRPTSRVGLETEFAEAEGEVAGAVSEPLGSPTAEIEDVITRTEARGVEPPRPSRRRPDFESETETEDGPEELPLFEQIRESRGGGLAGRAPIEVESEGRMSEFLAEERAQLQLGSEFGRAETEPEVEPEQATEFQDFSQLELERQAELRRRRDLPEPDVELVEAETQRLREAQRPRVETEAERDRLRFEVEPLAGTEQLPGADVLGETRADVDQLPLEIPALEQALEQESETEAETEAEQELEREVERETFREIEREQEIETEFETERETEAELETELFDRDGDREEELAPTAFGVESADIITEFRNPLTGEVIETERDVGGFL